MAVSEQSLGNGRGSGKKDPQVGRDRTIGVTIFPVGECSARYTTHKRGRKRWRSSAFAGEINFIRFLTPISISGLALINNVVARRRANMVASNPSRNDGQIPISYRVPRWRLASVNHGNAFQRVERTSNNPGIQPCYVTAGLCVCKFFLFVFY